MNLLVSFAPFILFAVLLHLGQPSLALWGGALAALALILRERFVLRRSVKILEAGTALLFTALALYTAATGQVWSIPQARLVVDAGLLLIVLVSLLIGQPFTLQYAREETPPEVWSRPEFLAANRQITWVWAGAFAVLVLADAVMAFLPRVPHAVGVLMTVAALYGAFRYTQRRAEEGAGPG